MLVKLGRSMFPTWTPTAAMMVHRLAPNLGSDVVGDVKQTFFLICTGNVIGDVRYGCGINMT